MTAIWTGMTTLSLLCALVLGRGSALAPAALEGAAAAVELALGMAGALCLWMGVMEVMARAGLAEKLAKLLSPLLSRLFPDFRQDRGVMDAIALTDNQTLYLSGGAVLHSIISVANAENVRICGRGLIDGSDYPAWNQPGSYARVPIDLNHSKNVTVEGIGIVNSNCWNFNSYSSKNVTVDNVKIISGRQNGDGFTFQSCVDHVVTNSFARTWDDSLVIKNYSGSTKGITFKNMQVWTDLAQSMEIGYETDKGLTLDPEITDVLFEDITVLYNFHKPVISIHNSDDAFVHGVTYRNIMVENAMMQGDNGNNKELIEMTLQNSSWSTVRDEFGSIDDVLIDGLTVLNTADGKIPASRLAGQGEDNRITNVRLKNVSILGQPVTDLRQMKLRINEFCEGITVE